MDIKLYSDWTILEALVTDAEPNQGPTGLDQEYHTSTCLLEFKVQNPKSRIQSLESKSKELQNKILGNSHIY